MCWLLIILMNGLILFILMRSQEKGTYAILPKPEAISTSLFLPKNFLGNPKA